MKTLNIQTNWAVLDIHTQYARLEISNNIARKLRVTVIKPQMIVERKLATVRLDYSKRHLPRLNNLAHLKQFILQGNRDKLQNAVQVSINKNNSMDNLTAAEAQPEFTVELKDSDVVSEMPQVYPASTVSPEVVLDPGYLKIDWTPGQIQMEWEISKPDVQVTPHSVEISLRGKKMVNIAVVEDKLPRLKGRKINKRI